MRKFNMEYQEKINMKRKFYSLIHSKDIFNFAEIKGEILNILIDKKTENCVRNFIEEFFCT